MALISEVMLKLILRLTTRFPSMMADILEVSLAVQCERSPPVARTEWMGARLLEVGDLSRPRATAFT